MNDIHRVPGPRGASIPGDLRALMERGVSAIVSSSGLARLPSVMRAVATALCTDGVTVYLSRPQSMQLLQDIGSTGRIAVVFSEPISHRTVQVKGTGARIRSIRPDDVIKIERYLASMEIEIQQVGFDPEFTHAMLAHRPDDLVAVSFVPSQAFDQTPGAKAGASLSSTNEKEGQGA
ncbi:hypothetical protein AB4Z46_28235 [Variovorax sp. M-6]|uniref:hypothetical protein n=1 Tax=Variovorax sp. M-6 TaxID=3233041 RepID=UPI003F94F834